MFSSFIQNLLTSSSESAALMRAQQMNANINRLYPAQSPAATSAAPNLNGIPQAQPQSFDEVLKSSMPKQVEFGQLLLNPKTKSVQAKLYNPQTVTDVDKTFSQIQEIQRNQLTYNIEKVVNEKVKKTQTTQATGKSALTNLISQVCENHGVDENLINAIIKQESNYNPNAKSKAGAVGLMQLMPSTAKAMGVKDPYNTVQNLNGGVKYFKSMLNKYNGNVILALAAYNAGPGAVDKYQGVPPYKETQEYVKKVLANYL